MGHVLAIDQGTTSSRAIVFDAAHAASSPSAQEEFPQHFPQSGWVEHDPDDIWSTIAADLPRRDRAGRARRRPTSPPSASPTSARRRWSGSARPASRSAAPSSGRTAAPRRSAPSCARPGHEAMVTEQHRAAARPLLLRHQAQVAARRARGRARAGAARRAPVRHRRQLADLEADRRPGARRPTPPTPRARCSTTSATGAWDPEICALLDVPLRDAAGGARLRRRLRRDARRPLRPARSRSLGVAGDQQAATVGQACFAPGMLKSTYGTGCFAVLNTGDDAGREPQPAADHHRLPARRQAHLRAGRLDLHRRRRGAVAARRAEDHPPAPPRPRRWPRPPTRRSGSTSCRPSPASARPTGTPTAAARSSASPATPARPSSPAPRSRASPTRPATSLEAMRADWPATPATPCSGSTAA